MNLTIHISEEKAAALKALADAHGLTVERWLEQIAEQTKGQDIPRLDALISVCVNVMMPPPRPITSRWTGERPPPI